jgi:hypothetical protein
MGATVFEKAYGCEGKVRIRCETTESGLKVVEGCAEHGLAKGAALGDANRASHRCGGRGDATHGRLLLDDDDFGRQELSTHDAPRLFFVFAFGALASWRTADFVEMGVGSADT